MKPKLFLIAICIFFLTVSICFGFTATFTPRLSVGAEYTDNVFLTGDENLEEDDVITTITAGFDAELLGKTYGANVSYDAAYAMYDDYDTFDGWRHRANLDGWFQTAKHTRLGLRDSFFYTEEPIRNENLAEVRTEDPNLPVDSTIRRTRRVYYENFAMVDLNHQFGKYDSFFTVGYKHWFREEDDTDLEDKESHTPFAGVTYWFMPKWGFALDGSYTRGEFDFSDDVDIYTGSVSLLKRFSRRFTGFLRYSHNVVDYENKYKGETESDTIYNPSVGIQYDIVTAGLGLTWRVLDWMSLGLDYRYRNVDSTINSEEYDENRVTAGITVVPLVRYRTSRYQK